MKIIRKLTEIYLLIYLIFISGSYYQLANQDIITASYIMVAVLVGIWAAYILIAKKTVIFPEYKTIYILFLLSGVTSCVHSLDITGSFRELYLWIIYVVMFIGILSIVNYGWDKKSLLNSALVVGLIYNAYKLSWILSDVQGLFNTCIRGSGIESPNKTGMMINLIIILAIGALLQGPKKTEKHLSYILLVTGGLILFATGSRGALMAAPAGILATLYINNIRRDRGITIKTFIIAGIVSYIIVIGFIFIIRPVTCSPGSWTTSITARGDIWKYAIYLFAQRPLFGTGLNSFSALAMPVFNNSVLAAHPHNIYLKILAERGLFGLITSAMLTITIFVDLLINSREPGLAAAAIGGIITVLIHGTVDYSLSEPHITRYLVIIIALAAARTQKESYKNETGI